MRCSRHRARKVASRTLPSTAEGSGGYPRGVNTLSGASVLAANDPFGAGADLGFEKRCVPQTLNRQSVPLSRDGSRPTHRRVPFVEAAKEFSVRKLKGA